MVNVVKTNIFNYHIKCQENQDMFWSHPKRQLKSQKPLQSSMCIVMQHKGHYWMHFLYTCLPLCLGHQRRVRSRENWEHQAHAAVPGCSERPALLDRAADSWSKSHLGGYEQNTNIKLEEIKLVFEMWKLHTVLSNLKLIKCTLSS